MSSTLKTLDENDFLQKMWIIKVGFMDDTKKNLPL
jgi:hypothetical protein